MKPWKVITMSEDYTTNTTDRIAEMLGLPESNTGRYIYAVVFIGNTASPYPIDFVVYVFTDGSYINWNIRENWSNDSTARGRTLNISAGTVIKIYKIPLN